MVAAFKLLATAALLVTGAFAKNHEHIQFLRWDGPGCEGNRAGKNDRLESDHCKTWGHRHAFGSYTVNAIKGYHGSGNGQPCEVIVYSKPDCQGEGMSMGSFPESIGQCMDVDTIEGGRGQSAAVVCGKSVHVSEES